MDKYQQYEQDERANILRIIESMNQLHAKMGGRDNRPERKALLKCMHILTKENERATSEIVNS